MLRTLQRAQLLAVAHSATCDGANLKKNGALRFGRVGPLAPARLVCIIGE